MKGFKSQKISLGEKVGYSLGDAAANLVFQMMMIFQLKFYTDVFGLDGAVAGSILIPFCIFYMLAFYNPGIEEKGMVATYATISYVLLMTVYSFNNIPYTSLGGVMTSDIRERTSITTIRFILVTIAQFVVQGLTLPLVNHLGGGDQPKGWTATVILYASIAFILFGVTFFSTKERIQPPPAQKVNIAEDIKDTVSNISWNSMALLTFAIFITLAMWGSAMNFYFQHNVDQRALYEFLSFFGLSIEQEEAYSMGFSVFNMMGAIVQFVGVITLSRYLANKYGKKNTFVVCLSLTASCAHWPMPPPSRCCGR